MKEMKSKGKENKQIEEFQTALLNGNLDKAEEIKKNLGFSEGEIHEFVVRDVMPILEKKTKFRQAIDIAKKYDFNKREISDLVYLEFKSLIKKSRYKEAAEWGRKHDVPKSEVNVIAERVFSNLVREQKYEEALSFCERFELNHDRIYETAIDAFNGCFNKRYYLLTALYGKKFKLSDRRTTTAAAMEILNCIEKNDLEKIVRIESDFNIFSDNGFSYIDTSVREILVEEFTKKLIDQNFEEGKENVVFSLLENLQLLNKRITFKPLIELIDSIYNSAAIYHNKYLRMEDISRAKNIIEFFNLFDDDVPYDIRAMVINGAIDYHNKLLKDINYSAAKQIKNDYKLHTENLIENSIEKLSKYAYDFVWNLLITSDLNLIPEVIREYSLNDEEKLKRLAKEALFSMLEKEKYKSAIEILKKFNLDPKDQHIEEKAHFLFESLEKRGEYEAAADIGLYFNLDKERVDKLAVKAWTYKIKEERFDEALNVYNRFKTAKGKLKKQAKRLYGSFLEVNDVESAKRLRREYKLRIGFTHWFEELFKSFLKLTK